MATQDKEYISISSSPNSSSKSLFYVCDFSRREFMAKDILCWIMFLKEQNNFSSKSVFQLCQLTITNVCQRALAFWAGQFLVVCNCPRHCKTLNVSGSCPLNASAYPSPIWDKQKCSYNISKYPQRGNALPLRATDSHWLFPQARDFLSCLFILFYHSCLFNLSWQGLYIVSYFTPKVFFKSNTIFIWWLFIWMSSLFKDNILKIQKLIFMTT